MQPPQPVPALVSAFSAATVWQPLLTARMMSPLLTSKQEQICALSGSESTPMAGLLPAWAGRIRPSGFFRQFDAVQRQLQQVAIIAGVAHQHRAEQGLLSALTTMRL